MGAAIASLAGAALIEGCGVPSSTLAIQLAGHGSVPEGMARAPFSIAAIDAELLSADQGDVWIRLLGASDGEHAYDLTQLDELPTLVAEQDVPEESIEAVRVTFGAPPVGGLPTVAGASPLELGAGAVRSSSVSLVIDFDVGASVVDGADGGYAFHPVAELEESP